jgi:Tol biopolymer transport system component
MLFRRRAAKPMVAALLAAATCAAVPAPASAQYFGQNKVAYERLDFRVLKTEHFDVYFYPEEEAAAAIAARMAERWRQRLGSVLGFQLVGRQPIVLFASHPHFEQTNVIEGLIDPATGGVTEGLRRRIALPFAATLGDTDHVLGHEIVHAYQYQALGLAVGAPLWFIEGMAEYLSIGPADVHTAMFLRDAALRGRFPEIKDLDNPRYFPYRFGHAFWAYIAGRFGESLIGHLLTNLADPAGGPSADVFSAIESATGRDLKTLSAEWRQSVLTEYALPDFKERVKDASRPTDIVIGERLGGGRLNVGPSFSPDGRYVAFLSERNRLSVEAYVAEAETGRITATLTKTAVDPHFQSLHFLASAGAWRPDATQLAYAAVRKGRPVLAIVNAGNGDVVREIRFPDLGEIYQPAWSPDGKLIAFAGQVGGVTDLFVIDLESGTRRRLTQDPFADLQPAWSPDGTRLTFVTDRFTSDLDTLAFGDYRLASLDLAGGAPQPLALNLEGDQTSPSWSDTGWLYFLSTSNGTQDIYRLTPKGVVERVTRTTTGVTGITPLSPALSVEPSGGRVAFSMFRDGGYEIHVVAAAGAADVAEPGEARVTPELPPRDRRTSAVTNFIRQPKDGLPPDPPGKVEDADSGLHLLTVGQALGMSVSRSFGAAAVGGLSLVFSDTLGNHLVATDLSINGGVRDIGGQLLYLNRSRRWYWGVIGEHMPFTSGFVQTGLVDTGGGPAFVEEIELFRQTHTQAGALTAYPFSRALRVEFASSVRQIGFSRELQRRVFDFNTGNLIAEEKIDLSAPESLRLLDVSAALVRDTTSFGATGPIVGQRTRLEVAPTFGDLRFTGLSLDVRKYFMPAPPVTFAVRGLHQGRYGASAESERISPLYLGYSSLVRGYDIGTFTASDCTPGPVDSCPESSRLIGSRILVGNLEVRAPLVGLFRGRLDYGGVPIDVFAFADTGVAWTRNSLPRTFGGTRDWVSSVGFGSRINAFGFMIVELNMVRPLNRQRGWMFTFGLAPGF